MSEDLLGRWINPEGGGWMSGALDRKSDPKTAALEKFRSAFVKISTLAKLTDRIVDDGWFAGDQNFSFDLTAETISMTMEKSHRVIRMIEHLRAAEGGEASPGFQTSIHDAVFQVLRAMQYEFPMGPIMIVKILSHTLPPVKMKPEHLEAVLFQLLYRARESFGGKAGIVTIEARGEYVPEVNSPGVSGLLLRVSDTAPRVEAGLLAGIFDPDFLAQYHGNTKPMVFFVVKKITELYGGSMRVESNECGTSVFLRLPV
jgi:nitrogen-specific signal transduction histidine kinase